MKKIMDRKKVTGMTLLFVTVYMVSYITRINYGAVIADMVIETGFSKSMLSMAVTGSFITYGTGQIVSGICGDRFRPKMLILLGFIVTVIMNLLIPICKNPVQMTAVWCVNGFAQAFMWPPLVKIMATVFTIDDYNTACINVSWGSSFGTIIIYLLSPVFITFLGWKSVFVFSAVCGIIMAIIWQKFCVDVAVERKVETVKQEKQSVGLFTPLMLSVMLAIVLQGMIRDGVTTWVPSYLCETYNMSSASSILSGVVLPIFSIVCHQVAGRLYKNILPNPIKSATLFFFVGTLFSVMVMIFNGNNAAVSLISSAVLAGCMHGVNLMFTCMVPSFFRKTGNISMVSGVLNSCTYIGSAISTYGIARVSEVFGWNSVIILWGAIAIAGTIVCIAGISPWKKSFGEKAE